MARKAKEEFKAKTDVLPDKAPEALEVLEARKFYIHPALGPVYCERLVNEQSGLKSIPSAILLELYPEKGADAKRITVPQAEVKGNHIRYPASAKEITEVLSRLGRPEEIRVWAERPNCGKILLSGDPQKWVDIIARTLGTDLSIFPPATRPRDMDIKYGQRAMGLLARECAYVMQYDLDVATAMVRDSLKARTQNRDSGMQSGHPTSRP